MIAFKPILQASQDGNCIFHGRFVDLNFLEPAFQRRILFNILAVFVKRRRADTLQLAPRQHRLQQIGRVHGAFRLARTDQIMNLVNKQDDVAVRLLHFVQHCFQPFLKLAAVFRTGDQGPHIQLDQFLFLQAERDVAVHDPPRDTFDNRRLPDARFADQHRVILCFP